MTSSEVTDVEENAFTNLARILSAPTRRDERERIAYLERLASFSSTTYFAKPPSLSPIVCARFGWKNVQEDVISCEKCQSVVAITYMPGLSTYATDKLTCLFEKQLASAHKDTCAFRKDAIKYFAASDAETNRDTILPSIFLPFFPTPLVELVESKRPLIMFDRQLRQNLHDGQVAWEKLRLEIHPSLQQYCLPISSEEDNSTHSLGDALYTALVRADETNSRNRLQTAALVFLQGWQLNQSEEKVISFQCPLCRKAIDVELEGTSDSSNNINNTSNEDHVALEESKEPPIKRSRQSGWDPLSSHRYYCPYVCGFPIHGASRATPLWKALADRILAPTRKIDESSSEPGTNSSDWERVNAILNAGIVRGSKMPV